MINLVKMGQKGIIEKLHPLERKVLPLLDRFTSFDDILLQSTRPSRDHVKGEDGMRMNAFRLEGGNTVWDEEIQYSTFPIIHGSKIVTEGGVHNLLTGKPLSQRNPVTGKDIKWEWKRHFTSLSGGFSASRKAGWKRDRSPR